MIDTQYLNVISVCLLSICRYTAGSLFLFKCTKMIKPSYPFTYQLASEGLCVKRSSSQGNEKFRPELTLNTTLTHHISYHGGWRSWVQVAIRKFCVPVVLARLALQSSYPNVIGVCMYVVTWTEHHIPSKAVIRRFGLFPSSKMRQAVLRRLEDLPGEEPATSQYMESISHGVTLTPHLDRCCNLKNPASDRIR